MKLNLPTKITLARIALIPIILVFYYLIRIHPAFILVMTAFFIIASSTDAIDGHIARSRNMVTTLGKFLDPIADKALVVTGLFIIVDSAVLNSYEVAGWCLGMIGSVIIMVRELAISAFRQIAATKGVVMAADKWGKAKTIFTLIAIPALFLGLYRGSNNDIIALLGQILWWFGLIMFIVSVVLTIISGFNYVIKNKQVFADNDEKKSESQDDSKKFSNVNAEAKEDAKVDVAYGSASLKDLIAMDNRFEEALRYIVQTDRVSISYLQRKLGVGYPRAAKIFDLLESSGYISDGRSTITSAELQSALDNPAIIPNILGKDDRNIDIRDPRFLEALKVITGCPNVSVSFIQRKLDIDTVHANKLLNLLIDQGFVNNNTPVYTAEELHNKFDIEFSDDEITTSYEYKETDPSLFDYKSTDED